MTTILCVDQPEVLRTRRLVLERSGYKVRTAHTQPEAMEVLRQHAVDCVVVRHDLPLLDGLEANAAIRRLYPQLPIVLLATVPPRIGPSRVEECLSNLDGPEALVRAVERAVKKGNSLAENLQNPIGPPEKLNRLEMGAREAPRNTPRAE